MKHTVILIGCLLLSSCASAPSARQREAIAHLYRWSLLDHGCGATYELFTFGPEVAVPIFLDKFRHLQKHSPEKDRIRAPMLNEACCSVRHQEGPLMQILSQAAEDPAIWIRQLAAGFMMEYYPGGRPGPEGIALLKQLAADPEEDVRKVALEFLSRMQNDNKPKAEQSAGQPTSDSALSAESDAGQR